ncbi:hypothetical protein Q4543_13240 [Salipiger sp. 1_MG-2023]|uniref:hypothetical protein n=1 Tax=Salipiger sp. 1_MG-2023 TaxID=3062665 RepID=UPI0026E1D30D|nr:hypothetical protein [Salipiger sp. 1_MG-2023]MDO6586479.1 hypothetical protein [Salipiger sp. 1_MG-2023]
MVSSSKILTVSYGTFSCTAEGFEDPLGVVKETTHFFRGVVRDDRFFGAEPPQFDPEMASEILSAQLAPRHGEGQLTLGTGDASANAMGTALQRPVAEPEPTAAEMPEPDVAEDPPIIEDVTSEVLSALAEQDAQVAPASDAPTPTAEDSIASLLSSEAMSTPEMPDILPVSAGAAPVAPPTGLSDPDAITAKLQRIRAVVAQGAVASPEPVPDLTLSHDEPESAVADDEALAQEDLAEEDLAEEDAFDQTDLHGAAFDAGETGDNRAAPDLLGEPSHAEPAPLTAQAAMAAQPLVPPVEDAASAQPPRARVVKVKRSTFDAAADRGLTSAEDTISSLSAEDEDDLARELEAVRAELQAGFAQAWADDEDEAEDDEIVAAPTSSAAPLRRAEAPGGDDEWLLGEGWENDLDDEDDEDAAPDPHQAAAMMQDQGPVPRPAPTQEAEPVDLLADDDDEFDDAQHRGLDDKTDAPEAETPAPAEEDRTLSVTAHLARMAQEEVRKAIKMSSPGRVMLTETSVEDNDASRILDVTNSQLREPEGNRRRSAIAHLRAAVAATRADRKLGRKKDLEKASEPYREDLADVVRPRRPDAPVVQTERPVEATRPAPLKLVAEQRVDAERVPTRPRRVRVADFEEESAATDEGFADYAESVGARELPELLEAAAAYMSFVECREQFSRPQLMTKVRQVEQHESSREDRLRSFGQLLREGKIEKTRGGRFTASERISFKPDARAVG